mmetsp:Transcript_45630/g.117934  ORF Transcript_45630/g.117934 Transcript_45630/m.117934 type:complete len:117 (+) Transcript_45630:354-704(+)
MGLSSYGKGTESKGSITVTKNTSISVKGRRVLVIEDIVDTGNTLKWLLNFLKEEGAADVRTCVLFDKSERRDVEGLEVEHIGFHCPNEFIVGYGLDFAEQYRTLPFVGVLKPEAYA